MARRQLLALGFSSRAIERRIARGRLHPIMPGVYAVGRPGLGRHGHWMAAVLACGQTAVLSHTSAAALWGFAEEDRQGVHVSVVSTEHRRPGICVHRRRHLQADQITSHDGVPVTTLARTMVDLATELSRPLLERAVNEADNGI